MIRLVAEDDQGKQYIISTDNIGSANVVLLGMPCSALVSVGDFVRVDSVGLVVRAIANSMANSNILGCVESKQDSNTCDVRVLGVTPSNFSSLDVTKEYFLSDTIEGGITSTPPSSSGSVRLKVGQPTSSNKLLILKGERTLRS